MRSSEEGQGEAGAPTAGAARVGGAVEAGQAGPARLAAHNCRPN